MTNKICVKSLNTHESSTMDPNLREAYRNTTYVASTPRGRLRVRIGQSHPDLDALLAAHDAQEWAYITAWNPGSEPLSVHQNHERQMELEGEMGEAGYELYRGSGVPDADNWQPEESVLVVGIPRRVAVEAGARYGQMAIVYGRAGEPAELVWCGAEGEAPA